MNHIRNLFVLLIAAIILTSSCSAMPAPQPPEGAITLNRSQNQFAHAISGMPTNLAAEIVKVNTMTTKAIVETVVVDASGNATARTLHVMKGTGWPIPNKASYYILFDPQTGEWFKMATSSKTMAMMPEGFESLRLATQRIGAPEPKMVTLNIHGGQYSAYSMIDYGESVASLILRGETQLASRLYQDAFHEALWMCVLHGRCKVDANINNVIGRANRGLNLDWETATAAVRKPGPNTIEAVQREYTRWAKDYGLDFDPSIPGEITPYLMDTRTVGRVFKPSYYVDYMFTLDGLDTVRITNIRQQVNTLLKNSDDVVDSMIVVEGVEVTLIKVAVPKAKNSITATIAVSKRSLNPNVVGLITYIIPATMEIRGWNGIAINVATTFDGSVENGKLSAQSSLEELWDQSQTYKSQLVLYAKSKSVVEDNWFTTLAEAPEISYYIEQALGMTAYETDLEMKDAGLDIRQRDQIIANIIRQSDVPIKANLRFAEGFPGLGHYNLAIPIWVSTSSEDGVDYITVWYQDYYTMYNIHESQALMPVVIAQRPAGVSEQWEVLYYDPTRSTIGFKVDNVVDNLYDAECSSQQFLQFTCWFVRQQ